MLDVGVGVPVLQSSSARLPPSRGAHLRPPARSRAALTFGMGERMLLAYLVADQLPFIPTGKIRDGVTVISGQERTVQDALRELDTGSEYDFLGTIVANADRWWKLLCDAGTAAGPGTISKHSHDLGKLMHAYSMAKDVIESDIETNRTNPDEAGSCTDAAEQRKQFLKGSITARVLRIGLQSSLRCLALRAVAYCHLGDCTCHAL